MAEICKKCGYERQATDVAPNYECPKCGAVYAKVDALLNKKAEGVRVKREEKEKADHERVLRMKEEQQQAQLRKPQQIVFLTLLLTIFCLVGLAIWWKIAQDTKQEQLHHLDEQKLAFEEQVKREHDKNEFDKAIGSLTDIYLRWNDAVKLANTTARIAVAGPVGNLQAIKQEADKLLVPNCLTAPKKKMVEGMDKIISGFIQFMGSANSPRLEAMLAQAAFFDDGNTLLREYESGAKLCVSQ